MLVKYAENVTMNRVTDEGAVKAKIAILIGPDEGAPNFTMRRIELESGGCTPHHAHPWEHVVYVLEGKGKLLGERKEFELKPGAAVLVPPGEVHQFAAAGDSLLVFLCSIPKR
jgi:quercetin dioxygenase-like cupin family protein